MVKLPMSSKRTRYFKLIHILFQNNKALFIISLLTSAIGFCFIFTVTSTTNMLIQNNRDNLINTYGKFLAVISNVDEKTEANIKNELNDFTYKRFEVGGNAEYSGKKLTFGSMEKSIGDVLAFSLIKGEWPEKEKEIVVEEYLTELFKIKNNHLPAKISFEKNGIKTDFIITGIISNYSSRLSASTFIEKDINVYPTVIFADGMLKDTKQSLIVLQKKLRFNSIERDINTILNWGSNYDIKLSHDMSINSKLASKGYSEDLLFTRLLYLVLTNFLLLLGEVIIIRTLLIWNSKTMALFKALGLHSKQERILWFYLIGVLAVIGLGVGFTSSAILGVLYIKRNFVGYQYYIRELLHTFLLESSFISVIIILFCVASARKKAGSLINEMLIYLRFTVRKYRFRKMDICVVIIQMICMFFIIASFSFSNRFEMEKGDINYDLYSKATTTSSMLRGYSITENNESYFDFDVVNDLHKYGDMIKLQMEAETNQSSILIDKDDKTSIFNEYLKYRSSEWQDNENEERWYEVSKEAERYNALPDRAVKIIILTEKEFGLLLDKLGIGENDVGLDKDKNCLAFLPKLSYSVSGKNEIIQVGGIRKSEKGLRFYKEKFKAMLWNAENEEDNIIQLVMKENTVKKSKLILGYDKISINLRADAPLSVKQDVDTRVSLIMSSIQGGMLESSVLRNKENKLMGDYTAMLSGSMVYFSLIVVCLYIVLSSYIDWEKHKHEYGILRSFGMSYVSLWRKIFFRYFSSIFIACIVLAPLVRGAFSVETLSNAQILFSIMINIIITFLCGSVVYWRYKSKSIVNML